MKNSRTTSIPAPIIAAGFVTLTVLVIWLAFPPIMIKVGDAAQATTSAAPFTETASPPAVLEFVVKVDTNSTLVDLANSFDLYDKPSKEGWRGVGDSLVRYDFEHGHVVGDSTQPTVSLRLCTYKELPSVSETHRPATMRELLSFGLGPKADLFGLVSRDIVALGTKKFLVSTNEEAQVSPCIYFYKGKGSLAFTYYREWPETALFAMTRK